MYGEEDGHDEAGGDRKLTTAIQHFQTLWLRRCSFAVGHSNSK
jgi:hypothetical protein